MNTKMAHTPGPWKAVFEATQYDYAQIVTDERVPLLITHVNKYPYAGCDGKANARLIAAAPDLLALVEQVEWEYGPQGVVHCPWCHCCQEHGHASDCPRQAVLAQVHNAQSL